MKRAILCTLIAAALLLYRLLYYLVPFALALILLSLYEAWRALGGSARHPALNRLFAATEPAFRAVEPAAPLLLAIMVFGSGMWMSLSALLPPVTQAAAAAICGAANDVPLRTDVPPPGAATRAWT